MTEDPRGASSPLRDEEIQCFHKKTYSCESVLKRHQKRSKRRNGLRVEEMMHYFQNNVERYKRQDRKGKRIVEDSRYVTKEWLANCVGDYCNFCGDCLFYARETEKGCNIAAQRIDCKVGHHLDNIVPCCIHCNCATSNRD